MPNSTEIKGNWEQLKGKMKQKFADLGYINDIEAENVEFDIHVEFSDSFHDTGQHELMAF